LVAFLDLEQISADFEIEHFETASLGKLLMSSLKQYISESINVDQSCLNEISLDDVRFVEDTQICIRKAVIQMLALYEPFNPSFEQTILYTKGVPCIGFWIENTKDLVLYFSIENQSRTIIVHRNGWMIRDDITIN